MSIFDVLLQLLFKKRSVNQTPHVCSLYFTVLDDWLEPIKWNEKLSDRNTL